MREIRTSGSTRGESVARFGVSPSPLLYTFDFGLRAKPALSEE
jgi:hypothetical protein